MKLGKTPRDRTLFEHLGDLFSLLVTMDHIEKAFVRDAISEQESVHSRTRGGRRVGDTTRRRVGEAEGDGGSGSGDNRERISDSDIIAISSSLAVSVGAPLRCAALRVPMTGRC